MLPTRAVFSLLWLLIATFLLVPTTACRGQDGGRITAPEISESATSLPFDTLFTQYYSDLTEPTRRLIDRESELAAFWGRIEDDVASPTVNFDQNVVVAAAMGERPTGGYTIGIEAVARNGDTLYARIRESSPGENCGTTLAFTQPVQAVRVPVTNVTVLATVERDTVRRCG